MKIQTITKTIFIVRLRCDWSFYVADSRAYDKSYRMTMEPHLDDNGKVRGYSLGSHFMEFDSLEEAEAFVSEYPQISVESSAAGQRIH